MIKSDSATLCCGRETDQEHPREQKVLMPISGSPNLLDLNDDCLLEVLQYLTIQDTFSLLGSFGNRINDIAHKRISQLKCLNCTLRDPPDFTPPQLQIIGQNLHTLSISVGYSLNSDRCISQYLKPLCHHGAIQNLTLNYVQFSEAYQQCILNLAPNLRFLDLSFCQLTDDLLQPIVENCLQLRTLSIIGNYDWEGKSLHRIKSQHLMSVTVELNDHCTDEVNAFIATKPQFCLNVHGKGRSSFNAYHKGHIC